MDPDVLETRAARCVVHVSVDREGQVCGVQQEGKAAHGRGGVGPTELLALLDVARAQAPLLLNALSEHLAAPRTTVD